MSVQFLMCSSETMQVYCAEMVHTDSVPSLASFLIKVEKLQKHSKCKHIHTLLWSASLCEGKTYRANGSRMVSVF